MDNKQVCQQESDLDEEEGNRLSLRSVGRYALIYDLCIWVMCDNVNVRKQAAAEQLMEWLQNANAKPTQEEVKRKFSNLRERLSIQELPVTVVMHLARQSGWKTTIMFDLLPARDCFSR
jgi:hypothetical protein